MIDVPVEVKDALREGTYKKNYRFVVLNEDGTESEIGTIDNNNLVKESVSIDERMCSGDTLKFGLCEGSSLEFQYFDKPNITGKRIQAFIDITYGYTETYVSKGTVPRYNRYITLTESGTCYLRASVAHAWQRTLVMSPPEYEPVYSSPTSGTNRTEQYLEGLKAGDRISVYNPTKTVYLEQKVKRVQTYTIPMGFFDVKKCSRQASTGIIKATCYNKLQSEYLDAKANELIDEAVTEGEWGLPSNTVSLRTILDRTLGNYSIEVAPNIEQSISVYSGSRSYNSHAFTRLTSAKKNSGYYLHVYYVSYWITIQGGFKSDSYYKISVDPKAIDDYFEDLRANLIRDGNDNLYDYFDGKLDPSGTAGTYGTYYELYNPPSYEGLTLRNALNESVFYSFLTNRDVERYTTNWVTGLSGNEAIRLHLPVIYLENTTYEYPTTSNMTSLMDDAFNDFLPYLAEHMTIVERALSSMEKMTFDLAGVETWGDVTLRDIQSAVYETQCQFGQLSRVTDLFSGVELNHSRLYPADSLYPDNALYPSGAVASGFKSMYSKLWADEGNVHKWKYLIITYKGLDGEGNEQDYTLQRTVNNDGTDNYNCSDNWLFRNLVWTAEQIGEYANAMVAKMRDITWFPFEMWCAGLPYLETGDEIEIPLGEETYTSYILQRQLKGIQNLQDTYINGTLDIF